LTQDIHNTHKLIKANARSSNSLLRSMSSSIT